MAFNPPMQPTPAPRQPRQSTSGEAPLVAGAPDTMRQAIEAWKDDPQLGRLHDSLLAHTRRKAYFDRYAEAIVARHLGLRGATFRYEVPVPNGRLCDFQVLLGATHVYLHIKRLKASENDDDSPATPIASRLRYLERIERPYIVNIRWRDELAESQMQQIVRDASQFIRTSRVGDEMVVRDDTGELAGLRIVAPWDGTHVTLATESSSGFVDDMPRFAKLMRKSAKQFMPGAPNVVLIASERANGRSDFESALLGTHIERWDAFPPKGRRIAHGRAPDGFWHGNRYFDYQAAGLFRMSPEQVDFDCKLWVRGQSGLSMNLMRRLVDLLDTAER